MQPIQKIIVPTDFSELSKVGVRYALDLAGLLKAQVIFVHVADYKDALPTHPEAQLSTARYKSVPEFTEERKKTMDSFLRKNFAPLMKRVQCRNDVVLGVDYQRIIDLADEENADMIVMSTHGRTGLGHVLMGSVTEQVVRRAHCPVLSVKLASARSNRLKKYLDAEKIKYVSINHSRAYTAQEVAESAHIPGNELAKTVMVKLGGKMAMAVVPSSYRVNLDLLSEAAGAKDAVLASEEEFRNLFPDCEIGAMPPFGNLYGMDVYAAQDLAADEEIAFNAGSHTELIRMSYKDFERLVRPTVIQFSALKG